MMYSKLMSKCHSSSRSSLFSCFGGSRWFLEWLRDSLRWGVAGMEGVDKFVSWMVSVWENVGLNWMAFSFLMMFFSLKSGTSFNNNPMISLHIREYCPFSNILWISFIPIFYLVFYLDAKGTANRKVQGRMNGWRGKGREVGWMDGGEGK